MSLGGARQTQTTKQSIRKPTNQGTGVDGGQLVKYTVYHVYHHEEPDKHNQPIRGQVWVEGNLSSKLFIYMSLGGARHQTNQPKKGHLLMKGKIQI